MKFEIIFEIILQALIELATSRTIVNIGEFCNILKKKNLVFSIYGNKRNESSIYYYLGEISGECIKEELPIITTLIDFKELKPFYRLKEGQSLEEEREKVFNFKWQEFHYSDLNELTQIDETKREVVLESRIAFPINLKREILQKANFQCENKNCKNPSSFLDNKGEVFLEIHHKIPYSQCKNHSLENCIALCPNCHKQIHFGNVKDVVLNR
jgi:hypothetical protein